MPTLEQFIGVICAAGMGVELSAGHYVVGVLGLALALAIVRDREEQH